jgi:hypothetical protein
MRIVQNRHYVRKITIASIGVFTAMAIIIAGIYFASTRSSDTAEAAGQGGLTFQQFATHPYAVNIPGQQRIFDMEVTEDGELIAGYGDWNGNIDSFGNASQRVGVVPLNLETGGWGDIFYAGSEAIDVIRKIDGKLYIPTTDPSNKAATGNPSGNLSGYITNETGEWTFVNNGKADVHTFDIAKRTNGELWTVGNNENPAPRGAVAWRSTDAGQSWQLGLDGPEGAESRYYWLASMNGTMYTYEMFTGVGLLRHDGTDVTSTTNFFCLTYDAKKIEVFDDKILCGQGSSGQFDITDGTDTGRSYVNITGANDFTETYAVMKDFYQTDTHLYALLDSGIFRTTSLDSPWERLTFDEQVTNSESIAVYEDVVYLGKNDGTIWKADQTISSMDPLGVEFEDCSAFDIDTGTITAYFPQTSLCPEDVVIPSTINGVAVTSIGANAFAGQNLTSVIIPEGITTIGYNAFGEFDGVINRIHSVTLPSTLKDIGSWAFGNNALTSISLPDGLESVGAGAFSRNQLTELTIPGSLETIEASSFSYNYLQALSIPESVTSIGDSAFEHNNLIEVTVAGNPNIGVDAFRFNGLDRRAIPGDINSYQVEYLKHYQDNAEFVRIFSTNADFLSENSNSVYSTAYILDYAVIDEEAMTWRAIYSDQVVVGGLLFNPAIISANYIDSLNNSVATNKMITGEGGLTGYRVSTALPYITKTAAAITDEAGNETTQFNASFNSADIYYRIGQTVTIQPQAIAGYIAPPAQTFTLSSAINAASFTYLTQPQVDGGAVVNPDGTVSAPNTGLGAQVTPPIALALIVLAAIVAAVAVRKQRSA